MPVVPAVNAAATTGNVWFVYSGSTNPADGTSPATPWLSVATALSSATASNGDVIYVMPGHAETIAAATTWSKAGVAIVGLGAGSKRPTFTLTTAATAALAITAANMSVSNCLFIANFADIAGCFTTTAGSDFVINGCEFRDTDATHNFLSIVKTSTVDNAADGLTLVNSKQVSAGLTANTAVLDLRQSLDRLMIQNNYIQSLVAGNSALIYQATTTKVLTTAVINNNNLNFVGANAATGILLITTATTHTGVISNNYLTGARAAASAILVTASSGFKFMENYYQTAADKSGILTPANV